MARSAEAHLLPPCTQQKAKSLTAAYAYARASQNIMVPTALLPSRCHPGSEAHTPGPGLAWLVIRSLLPWSLVQMNMFQETAFLFPSLGEGAEGLRGLSVVTQTLLMPAGHPQP